ncbi:MAG: NAD(P)/FAD-dependent oxidoreductase [Myxococcales bacterium]|nr:NAD(P)/FAD-dependent oxidoreductase [Myxococcales bacterium]
MASPSQANDTSSKSQEKYWNKRGKDGQTYDAIVIGSGMGGMTTAAMLAKQGQRVLVLEQHYTPGGFTHMFKRPGYIWDVGVHAVGEVTQHSMTGRLLHYLTDGQLEWASLGEVYDEFYYPDGFRIDFPDTPQKFHANLLEAFPHEKEAIDRYLQLVREISSGMRGYYMARVKSGVMGKVADMLMARKAQSYFERPTQEVLAELTNDPKLRAIFVAQWGYYGAPPSRSCFAIQALVTKHFLHGAYYPVGGAKRIAECLLKTVADNGGWTRISTDVETILVEKGRAVGVRLGDGQEIHAPTVVSAAGISSTIRRLLPQEVQQQSWAKSILDLPPAPAHVCLYLGFKGDITKAGAGPANKWFYETWDTEQDAWQVTPDQPMPEAPVLYCSFPSLKDPEHDPGPETRHTGEVVTFVPWETFQPWRDSRWKKRGGEYEEFKNQLQEKLLEQFFRHLPALRPMLDHVELSTPLSTDHFCRPLHGSIYGLEPTPQRFKNRNLRASTPVKGLFFSGSEVASVGVIGAMMGGVLGATAAAPSAMTKLLRQVSKR